MSIRGKTAIVGIGEIPTRRTYSGRSMYGLCAEASRLAIEDAGLRKEDIDGIITEGSPVNPNHIAEYIGIRPTFAVGANMQGASACAGVSLAAAAITAGYCNAVLIVIAMPREAGQLFLRSNPAPGSIGSEFETIYGPAVAANNAYGLIYQRHMHEFGTTEAQMAKLAADQRFNALKNPNAVFQGQPITVQDVINSRYVNEPLHMLECVMPCAGGAACVVTSLERARALPNPPVVVLGTGTEVGTALIWQSERITTVPAKVSAARAFAMAGYRPQDMQFAEFYD